LVVADPVFKWKALRAILEQVGLMVVATLLALLLKSSLQATNMMPLLIAFTAGTFGALVFMLANLFVDKNLRGMVSDTVGGLILKRR
jgi:uncharacterized membrane protein